MESDFWIGTLDEIIDMSFIFYRVDIKNGDEETLKRISWLLESEPIKEEGIYVFTKDNKKALQLSPDKRKGYCTYMLPLEKMKYAFVKDIKTDVDNIIKKPVSVSVYFIRRQNILKLDDKEYMREVYPGSEYLGNFDPKKPPNPGC